MAKRRTPRKLSTRALELAWSAARAPISRVTKAELKRMGRSIGSREAYREERQARQQEHAVPLATRSTSRSAGSRRRA